MDQRTEPEAEAPRGPGGLRLRAWGEGVPAVLVHGSISSGAECWDGQQPLAGEGFRLLVPDRRGYGEADPEESEDFLADARAIAELLGDGAHLVGHSYGALAALLAAADRPEAVLSLTAIEPPAFAVAGDEPEVAGLVASLKELWAQTELTDRAFLEAFLPIVGAPVGEVPEEMLAEWTGSVELMRNGRPPWEAEVPVEALRAAPFPKLVVSGGHSAAFDAVCDRLARGLGAERAEITGAGHEVQMVADPFNRTLLRLWRAGRELL